MNFGGDKREPARRISWLGKKMIEAKRGRDQKEMAVWGEKIEHIVCITDCHGFSVNSI